ncbi:MAG: AIM24 family protein [bacterium]|nr:AIM24 family protein [bacterium]
MAKFLVKQLEGSRFVQIHLHDEMVRIEAGALNYLTGDIHIHSRVLPPLGTVVKCLLANESVYRPTYTGTGVVTLQPSLGGFHFLDLDGETWIIERGAYLASEGTVDIGYRREPLRKAILSGEGLVYLQTRVRGGGRVVITTRGPIQEIQLEPGQRIATEGRYVVARSGDVTFSVRRATTNALGWLTSGEGWVRVYEGTGRLLLNPTPYWRYRVFSEKGKVADIAAKATA